MNKYIIPTIIIVAAIILAFFVVTQCNAGEGYIIYNPDGTITTVVPQPDGTWMIFADEGNGRIVPPRHGNDDGDYKKYPTWGNRWSPLDDPFDSGPK